MTEPLKSNAADFALVWARLAVVLPTVHRKNRHGVEEPLQEVRMTFRRKSGQWFATVGSVSRTGSSEAAALGAVVDVLESQAADRNRRASVAGWGT